MNPSNPLRPVAPSSTVADAPTEYFTTAAVSRITGVTERQLQWWDENNVLCPMQRNHKRMYSMYEVETARKLKRLCEAGIQVSRARRYLTWNFARVVAAKTPVLINDVLVVPK